MYNMYLFLSEIPKGRKIKPHKIYLIMVRPYFCLTAYISFSSTYVFISAAGAVYILIYLFVYSEQKRFYNRETIVMSNYEIHQCLSYPLSFYATQIINPLLNSRISANHVKVHFQPIVKSL